jgi:SOS response associated peptidase (SRAP)
MGVVAEKPMFRSAFKKRRCLIIADGYYEWKTLGPKQKQPYFIRLKNSEPFAFAGIWETWKGAGEPIESCAIITAEANELTRPIHNQSRPAGVRRYLAARRSSVREAGGGAHLHDGPAPKENPGGAMVAPSGSWMKI